MDESPVKETARRNEEILCVHFVIIEVDVSRLILKAVKMHNWKNMFILMDVSEITKIIAFYGKLREVLFVYGPPYLLVSLYLAEASGMPKKQISISAQTWRFLY
jgi:hypothetical protein